ncbi:MAG TPA: hypothetical protein VKF40_11570 [Burkholderiales bacterium]|nr:hypothetical protein [Burkholderiales bacterium]
MKLTPRTRQLLLAAAAGVTVAAAIYVSSAPKADAPQRAEPAPKAQVTPPAPQAGQPEAEQPREQLVTREAPPDIKDAFASRSWQPPPAAAPPPPPPPPPQAPPLPYRYMGRLTEDGQTTVYLMRGDAAVVARAGETLDGSYRLERIADEAVEFTYLPLKQRQTLQVPRIP